MEVFVYGTLTDSDRAAALLDTFAYHGETVLDGLHRVKGAYPTLAPDGRTRGRILRTPDIDVLDEYEGVERGLYARVSVPFTDAAIDHDDTATQNDTEIDSRKLAVYVGDPDALDVVGVSWPGPGSFRERVERYVRKEEVCVRRE